MTDPQTLPDHILQLDQAVFDLTKARTARTDTGIYTSPSLWVQMAQAVHGVRNGVEANLIAESRAPFWVTGYDWCARVEKKVREWLPNQQGHTLTLLLALPEQKWTPEQAGHVGQMTVEVRRWVREAEKYLNGESEMEYRGQCPECEEQYVWRHVDGEDVRIPTITITTSVVRCKWCSTEWETQWFARLIGIDVDLILDTVHATSKGTA